MNEYYSKLNLGKIKHSARTWQKRYPYIQNIALYLKTRTDEEDHIKYVIVVTVPKYPSLKLPDDENSWSEEEVQAYKLREYYNWQDESCRHIHQDIKTFYRDSDKAERFEWMWFNITPEEAEDLDGFNDGGKDLFIDLESELVLYETAEKAGYKEDNQLLKECKHMTPKFTPEQYICCTSIEDGRRALKNETRLEVVKAALKYEESHRKRVTMLKALKARIKKLQKERKLI